jgi:TolB-like protein
MGRIFLSYAREDRASAECLARVLESAGHSVWWDRHIDSGEEFSAEIEAELDKADVVLVAWSKLSVKSRWVRDEAAVGGDTNRLVPVSIDGSPPPMGFRQFQTLDLTRWKGRKADARTGQLLHAVERRMAESCKESTAPQVQVKRPPGLRSVKRLLAITALLVTIAALFLINRAWNAPQRGAPTLAVLPFTADASDAEGRKLASATHDAIVHTLSQGAFAVSVLDSLPAGGAKPSNFLLTGRVNSAADRIVATVRIEDSAHRYVLFSHQWEERRDKAVELPERIGAQVASQLSWTAPLIAIERRHPSDPAITAALLGGSSAGLDASEAVADYEKGRRLASKAPNSALAQINLAFSSAMALGDLPRDGRAEAVALGRRASDRALELAPEFGDTHIPWCLLHSEQQRIECEDRLRTGMRADPDGPFANFFLAALLAEVGRNRDAADLARLSYAHDPYMPHKIGLMLRTLEITGQAEEAQKLYRQAVRWWPDNPAISWRRVSGLAARGDFEAVQRFDERAGGKGQPSAVLAAINRKSLAGLRTACSAAVEFEAIMCMLALGRLGDLDMAFAFADKLYPSRRGRTPAQEERIWLDNPGPNSTFFLTGAAAAPLRRDARYLALTERVGLLEYWRSGRPPDFCHKDPEPICAQLLKG